MLHLVGFREDDAQLVEHLALLIKVGRHLQNCDEGGYRVVVRLKLFVEDADPVPKLRVLDVLEGVECVLIGVEALLEILHEEVAVTEGCPRRAVVGVKAGQLVVVLNCVVVFTVGCTVLSEFV